LLIFL
jgi:protein SDA1